MLIDYGRYKACARIVGFSVGLLLLVGNWGLGQVLPRRPGPRFSAETSHTADALLRNASANAKNQQWAEAIEIYQRVIQQFGDKVAELPGSDPASDPTGLTTLQIDLRLYCQRRLAELPPEALAIYRARVDSQAEALYRIGENGRDHAALRKLVGQMFCSSWGDDALDLLGDLAFQDGRFGEALGYYRQILPDRAGERLGLIYPDPEVDLAQVAAKKILCWAALGEDSATARGLEDFVGAYPENEGSLAGRTGKLSRILAEALSQDRLKPPPQADARWPTFAGSPARTKVAPGPIDVGSFQWKVELETAAPSRFVSRAQPFANRASPPIPPERLLAYHPIILGDQVIIANDRRVVAYNLGDRPASESLSSVRMVWQHEHEPGSVPSATRPSSTVPRFTLTAQGDRIFARMGHSTQPSIRQMGSAPQSYLVAIDRAQEGKLLWRRSASSLSLPDRRPDAIPRFLGFEGAPVADSRNVYVALTEPDALMKLYVACLDAESGTTRWIRYVGSAAGMDGGQPFAMNGIAGMNGPSGEVGNRLLSLDGPTLYYQTNMGAVAALDTETGGIRWVATYPRQEPNPLNPSARRELNPAILHDGLVLVAPEDAAAVFAFDALTGRLVWKSDPVPDEVRLSHLLGVAKGHLIATGDRVLWFDLRTGKLDRSWPEGARAYEGFGRGLLAGDAIYWPTRGEIQVLDQETGRREPPIKLQETFQTPGGNLAAGDGYLVIAQTDSLVVFCQNSRLIQRYKDEIAKAPEDASNYYRLARAAEATGQDELALSSFDRVLERARPSETIDGVPIKEAALDNQHKLLMRLGRRAWERRDWLTAESRYEAASRVAQAPRDLLRARMELAQTQAERGMPERSVQTLQELLDDRQLRDVIVSLSDGQRSVRADLLIGERLASLVLEHGRDIYAEYDRLAREQFERGKREALPRILEEVGLRYPIAAVVPDAWLTLGHVYEEQGRPTDTARIYKRLLASPSDDAIRAEALCRLGQAYEKLRLWVPAREAYAQARGRFADLTYRDGDQTIQVGTLTADRLSEPPFDRMAGDRSEPSLPIPLARLWDRRWDSGARPITAAGLPPSLESSRVFLALETRVGPIDPLAGKGGWSADLGSRPAWVGYLADRIVAASDARLTGLSLESGAQDWVLDLGSPRPKRDAKHPLARWPADSDPESTGALHGFRIVDDRVFCLRGENTIAAIDGETGLVAWSYTPTAGSVNPHVSATADRVILQTRAPNTLQVLEARTGRLLRSSPRPESEDWVRDPLVIDDDRVALVIDRRTVTLFDASRGMESWTYRESQELPRNGPPRLFADADRLFVLHDGNELIRLDIPTGTKSWSRPLGSSDLSERPDSLAVDGERFYCATGQSIQAINLSDGSLAWKEWVAGPGEGWSLALTDTCVLAYPDVGDPGRREPDRLPLVVRRRDSGRLVQRLLFPSARNGLEVKLAPRSLLVASDTGIWALGERGAVDGSARDR